MYHGNNTQIVGIVSAMRWRRIANVKSTTLRNTGNYIRHVPYHIHWHLCRTHIILWHADNHTKHVQYHVIPTTALDIYSTAIYRQPQQKITNLCHINAMWYVTSRTISASIVSIQIRQMPPHSQSSTRQTYSVVVTDKWKDGQIDRNATLCGLYLCSITRSHSIPLSFRIVPQQQYANIQPNGKTCTTTTIPVSYTHLTLPTNREV